MENLDDYLAGLPGATKMEMNAEDCFARMNAPPDCNVCSKPTALHCNGCSHVTHIATSYCSKACQKADWPKHKETCRMRKFYAAVRDLDTKISIKDKPRFGNAVQDISDSLKVDWNKAVEVIIYMEDIDLAARPQFLEYPKWKAAKLKDEVEDAIIAVKQGYDDGKDYMTDYESRVPQDEREKMLTDQGFAVPFDHRVVHFDDPENPCKRMRDNDEDEDKDEEDDKKSEERKKAGGGAPKGLMPLFRQDYECLSFADYVKRFGKEGMMAISIDPFSVHYIQLVSFGKELFARGMMSGKMVADDIVAMIPC